MEWIQVNNGNPQYSSGKTIGEIMKNAGHCKADAVTLH